MHNVLMITLPLTRKMQRPKQSNGIRYWEGVRWWRLGSELDAKTQAQIDRGKRIVEIFKQPPYNPIPVEVPVAVIWAVQNVKQAN